MIDGIAGNAFSAAALPPIDIEVSTENAEKVIRSSRERYARDRKEIEEKIARWTGMITPGSLPANTIKKESATIVAEKPKFIPASQPKKEEVRYQGFSIRNNSFPKESEDKIAGSNSLKNNFSLNKDIPKNDILNNDETKINSKEELKVETEISKSSQVTEINNPIVQGESVKITKVENKIETKIEEIKLEENIKTDNQDCKKELHQAECDTCGVVIQIPFKPDGERPTFCKDCLKDYQRAIARVQNEEGENKKRIARDSRNFTDSKREDPRPNVQGKIETQQKVYKSSEKPLKLSQTQFMAPKKIRDMDAGRELSKLREILEKNNQNKNNSNEVNVD
jgi:CxxC-x17-CxxC domain-containing protein